MMKIHFKKGFTPTPKFRNLVSGFTLLEALVAISILMVAVAAPITIAQKGLSSAIYTKDQMTASYLAQDALEYIKNKRDEVSINNGYDWTNLMGDPNWQKCIGANNCQIDTLTDTISTYSAVTSLSKDVNGFYGYKGGGTPTIFNRKVNITLGTIGGKQDVATASTTVSWPTGSVSVKTLIYNY